MSLTLLIISIAALGIAPVIARAWASRGGLRRALDGFVTIGVGGLVLTHILPPSIQAGGLAAWLFLIAGMVLPTAIERVQHGHVQTAHAAALVLAFLALSLHAMSDGVVLSLADTGSGWAFSTAFAVVLHRLPVGIAVWVFLRAAKGLHWVLWVFAIIAINTIIGFVAGGWVIALMQDAAFGWFQAFVAGSLLHVIFHAHEHDHAHDHGDPFGHGHDHVLVGEGSAHRGASAFEGGGAADIAAHPMETHLHDHPPHGQDRALAHDAGHHHHATHDASHHHHHHGHDDDHHHHAVHELSHHHHPAHDADPHHHGDASRHTLAADAVPSPHTYASLRCVDEPWDVAERSTLARALSFLDVRAIKHQLPEVLGAVSGVALVIFLSWMEDHAGHDHGHAHAHAHLSDVVWKFSDLSAHSEYALERWMHLALESSAWLLLGYILSAFFFYLVRQPSIAWLNRGGTVQHLLRGTVYGVAMPVRACGVVPVYGALVDRGARWGGATSFLYATPQLRLETVLFSLPLLGAPLMGLRVASMVLISLAVGAIAARLAPQVPSNLDASRPPALSLASAFHQALARLVDDTAPWVIFGLVVASLIPQDGFAWFAAVGSGWNIVIFGLLAIPIYLCATGATPVAAALLFAGVSPGAALVFLLAGPVTVLNSYRAMHVRAGKRFAWSIVVAGWGLVLGVGLLTDFVLDPTAERLTNQHNDIAGAPWQWGAFLVLMALFLWSLLRKGPRAWLSTIVAGDHG